MCPNCTFSLSKITVKQVILKYGQGVALNMSVTRILTATANYFHNDWTEQQLQVSSTLKQIKFQHWILIKSLNVVNLTDTYFRCWKQILHKSFTKSCYLIHFPKEALSCTAPNILFTNISTKQRKQICQNISMLRRSPGYPGPSMEYSEVKGQSFKHNSASSRKKVIKELHAVKATWAARGHSTIFCVSLHYS